VIFNLLKRLVETLLPPKLVTAAYLTLALILLIRPFFFSPDFLSFARSLFIARLAMQIATFCVLFLLIWGYARRLSADATPSEEVEMVDADGTRRLLDMYATIGICVVLGIAAWMFFKKFSWEEITGILLSLEFFLELRFRDVELRTNNAIFREMLYTSLAALCAFSLGVRRSDDPCGRAPSIL
jgi:formate hydrogenlyase subunit 3/multisubunit Na+/H+ antiporter MnhD subunit